MSKSRHSSSCQSLPEWLPSRGGPKFEAAAREPRREDPGDRGVYQSPASDLNRSTISYECLQLFPISIPGLTVAP